MLSYETGMEVFLIPVGSSRYELYCEMPDDDPADQSSSAHRPFFRNLLHRLREAIAEVERERHRAEPHTPPAGPYQRVKRAVLSRVAETMAEQRLLWHLRRCQAATLVHPDDVDGETAIGALRSSLRADYEKHRRWLIIDSLLFVVSGLLVLVPGPNVIAYYLAFRLVGHYLSMRGARQGLDVVQWALSPSAALAELRQAVTMDPDQRVARVSDIAARLHLERLVTFFQRIAVPAADRI